MIVNGIAPLTVGVPLMLTLAPLLVRLQVPDEAVSEVAKVYGGIPPVAVEVMGLESAVPSCAFGTTGVDRLNADTVPVRLMICEPVPTLLATVTWAVSVPRVKGRYLNV